MNKKAVFIGVGASVALTLLWFLLLWSPQGGRLDDAREREEAAAAENGQLEVRVARLSAAEERRPELTADLEALRVAVPDSPDLAQFLLDANGASVEAGVDFISISPTPPAPSATAGLPSEIGLNINVEGGYFQVIDFLTRVSALPRVVVVDSLGLTSSEGPGAPLSVSLTARMFTTATQVAQGPAPAATEPSTTTTTTAPAPSSVAAGPTGAMTP
jgi:type IV pilus assembly protein PilO